MTGHSISENQAGSAQHFWKPGRLHTSGKNWRAWENVIILVCPFRKEMLYSYSSELNTTIWARTVEQQGCPHVRKAQEATHISWGAARMLNPLKGTEIHLQLQSFFPTSTVQVCASWWKCEIQLRWHFLDMRYLNYIKNSISELICQTSFLGWGCGRK